MKCKKCKTEMSYTGEHYDSEEGWSSTYVCKTCNPTCYKKDIASWNRHLQNCKKEWCERCTKEGDLTTA